MINARIIGLTGRSKKNMLAIQCIRMYWEKENRSAKGAVMRRDYFKPVQIESDVKLKSEGCDYFFQKRWYIQTDQIYKDTEYNRIYKNRYINADGPTEAKREERIRRYLLEQNISEQNNKGIFLSVAEDVEIPGIEIIKEEASYRIKWYSLQHGYQPVRTGYNEDYDQVNTVCQGKRIKCETAFILKMGEAGRVQYNYRCTNNYGSGIKRIERIKA